jgi:Tfp pilus assembly protein PilN
MRAVNLLPRDAGQRTTSLPSTAVLVGICAGVLVIGGLGGDFLLQSGKVAKEQQQLTSLQAQVRALPPAPAGPTPAQTQLASEHSARVTAMTAALTTRVSWDRVFRELSLVLPDDVWLTTLTAHAPVSPASAAGATATGGAPSGFTLSGYTYSQDGVARLLSRLQVIPDLEHVTLVSSTISQVSNQDVVQFQIVADIRTSGSSSS